MDDHSESQHHDGIQFPSVPTSVTSAATRAVIRALERRGYDTTAIRKWPEFITDKVMDAIDAIAHKKEQGKAITSSDAQNLEKALNESPAAAPILITTAITELTNTAGPQSETEEILHSYAFILDIVCEYMSKAGTSLALRGFIHDADCISYWEKESDARPAFELSKNQLTPNNLNVYLIQRTPSEEQLRDLNTRIRVDTGRKLPGREIQYQKDTAVKRLIAVQDVRLVVYGLSSDERPDPFGLNRLPKQSNIPIPAGVPALIGMFESLFYAQEVQEMYVTGSRETRRVIEAALKAAGISKDL